MTCSFRRCAVLGMVLLLMVAAAWHGRAAAAGAAEEWSEGWSSPLLVGSTDRQSGPSAVVGLPGGTLLVTSVQLPGESGIPSELRLLRVTGDQVEQVGRVPEELPGTPADLRLGINPGNGTVYLLYTVSQGDTTLLRLARGTLGASGVSFGAPETVVRAESVLDDPGLAVAPDGRALVYWTDMEDGLFSVHASLFDSQGGIVFDRLRLTSPDRVQLRPAMAFARRGYFLAWVEKDMDNYTLYSQVIDRKGLPLAEPVELGSFPYAEHRAPDVVVGAQNRVSMTWTGATVIRGAAGRLTALYASFDGSTGDLLVGPVAVSPGLGSVVSPDLAVDCTSGAGDRLVTWADNRSEKLTVYCSRVGPDGSVLESGRVAVSNAEQLAPAGFVDEHGVARVVFHELDPRGEYRVLVVNDRSPAAAPWYWRLGLNYQRPVGDALFRFVNLVAAGGLLAVVRFIGIVFGLPLVWGLDWLQARTGAEPATENTWREISVLVLLFSVPFALETVGGVVFYQPVVQSGGLAWLRFALAAAGAVVFLKSTGLRLSDWLTRLLGGYMFLFWYAVLALCAGATNI